MGLSPIERKVLEFYTRRRYGQFRQAASGSTDYGALGCTHTEWQKVTELWTGRFFTHDKITQITSYPYGGGATNRGMRPSEGQEWVRWINANFGEADDPALPYILKTNLTPDELLAAASLGPVLIAHSYSRWPEWKGYVYMGVRTDGYPNGYARPLGAAGANQTKGFKPPFDAHMGTLLASGVGSTGLQIYVTEPNHGSLARPQVPAYDILTKAQFNMMARSYATVLGRTPIAFIPTRPLPV